MFWGTQYIKMQSVTSIIERENMELYRNSFYALEVRLYKFKVHCYNFRILNVIFMITTKKIFVKYTQKKIRESKYLGTKKIK